MQNRVVLIVLAVIIGAVVCGACFEPPEPLNREYRPDGSTTLLKVNYTGQVEVYYWDFGCVYAGEIMAPREISFGGFDCRMANATFLKSANVTGTAILTVDLVRDRQVVKQYSPSTGTVHFAKIPEFLVRSEEKLHLVVDSPLRVVVIADGGWHMPVSYAFGYQSENGSREKNSVPGLPVFPPTACIRGDTMGGSTPPVVELMFTGDTIGVWFGKTENANSEYCATMQ